MSDKESGDLAMLAAAAWEVRANAFLQGNTAVGAALLTDDGRVFVGCNVEHKFRSHDLHAEVNAIGSMIAGGGRHVFAIVIAAEREYFTPCGACMDWIFQFGTGRTIVAFQSERGAQLQRFLAKELMPHYPR